MARVAPASVTARGIEFSYLESGPGDGPLALVLHGFPDSPVSFTGLLSALGDAGYHAVAPWQRGYAPTSLAPDESYHVGSLAADANALHDALGGADDAVLLGHDWGASAVYPALAVGPHLWRRGVAMAVPPMGSMVRALSHASQLRRSWYMWLLTTPLAEGAVSADNFAFIDQIWAEWSPGLSAADGAPAIAAVKAAIASPAHLTAAVSYYRALFDVPPTDPTAAAAHASLLERPPVPVCYLHGEDDGCIGIEEIGDPLELLGEGSEYVRVPNAGHFLQLERPELVHASVLGFLG